MKKGEWEKAFGDLYSPFLKYFWEISQIPRKSRHEEEIAQYLVEFARSRGLQYYIDDLFNVIIYKEASSGYENTEPLGIQNHTDMICEKIENSLHDFIADPIDIYVDGNFVRARGTTLGADNGLGVAYTLAILDSETILVPRLECIFTTQEESTMNGAKELDYSKITTKKIISFDNFIEKQMCIGSATCMQYLVEMPNKYIELKEYNTFEFSLSGFKGGHSGTDIGDETRVNPIKIAVQLISFIQDLYINKIDCDGKYNVIPIECNIEFSIPNIIDENFLEVCREIMEQYPGSSLTIKPVQRNSKAIRNTRDILYFINSFENGSLVKDIYGDVVVSTNMGSISTAFGKTLLKYSIRHNNFKIAEEFISSIEARQQKSNFVLKKFISLFGYESKDDNNELIKYCDLKYSRNYYNQTMQRKKVQAGLEYGFFASKIPNLQYVCIGPNIIGAHTTEERFEIKSAIKFFDYILDLLQGWPMYK